MADQEFKNTQVEEVVMNTQHIKSPQSNERKFSKKLLPEEVTALGMDQLQIDSEKKAYVIGISGGDCAGKKLMMKKMKEKFDARKEEFAVLEQDSFYKNTNIHDPENTDWDRLIQTLASLAMGNKVKIRKYNHLTQCLQAEEREIESTKMIIVAGLHVLSNPLLRKLCNITIFIEADADVRLSRRVYQDTKVRKVPLDKCLKNYLENIKPCFERYIQPAKKYADILIPHFGGGYSAGGDIYDGGFQKDINKGLDLICENVLALVSTGREGQKTANGEPNLQNKPIVIDPQVSQHPQ